MLSKNEEPLMPTLLMCSFSPGTENSSLIPARRRGPRLPLLTISAPCSHLVQVLQKISRVLIKNTINPYDDIVFNM